MNFKRRIITKTLDLLNLQRHNDNYAEIETDLTAHNGRITSAQNDITTHKESSKAHPAEHVTYSGSVAGAANVKQAVDIHVDSTVAHAAEHIAYDGAVVGAKNLKDAVDKQKQAVDTLVVNGDSSPAAAQAKIDTFGVDQPTLKERLDKDYLRTAAQLADTSYFTGLTRRNKVKPTKGLVTFITDDASQQDYTIYLPLFGSLGVPFCTGVITSTVGNAGKATKAQLLEIQAAGNEIMSHSHTHPHLSELSDAASEAEFLNSKAWLLDNGFDVESFIIPYGFWSEREKEYAKKYYRACRVSDYGLNGLNQSPIETFELKCIWLDTNVVINNDPSGFPTNTFNYYKYYIDKAFEKNTWLIIGTHSWNVEEAGLTSLLTNVINYAKSKCEILTCSAALDKVGNILETGSYGRPNPQNKHFAVGYDGKINANTLDTVIQAVNSFTGSNIIDNFEDYQVTVNRVNTVTAISSGLPESVGGVLYTHKLVPRVLSSDNIYNYQIYHVLVSGNIYKRVCNADRSFGVWRKVSGGIDLTGEVANFDAGISAFREGITINYLLGTNAALSPTKTAGTLMTYRVTSSSANAFSYQEYSEYNGRGKFKRYATGLTTWGPWVEVGLRVSFPDQNGVDGNTTISTLLLGVTYNTVQTAVAASSGLPESLAGTLTTHKIHATDHAYNYQTYHIYGTLRMYKRSFNSAGTPTVWEKISAV
ncbi:polysaccharide deacetylase family protein [Paenibacillus sp. NPDC057934]|uniref:polysaccharide deacetylase family protein n=1 Tax=Paenibacillus sp. NPDC057934 TaxID=3346282 RepID=UPI0036DBFB9D